MRRPLLLLALVAVMITSSATPCRGQVYRLRSRIAFCERGQCVLRGNSGAAVAIGHFNPGFELLLTAAHLVDEGDRGKLQAIEISVDGQTRSGELRAIDRKLDLALVGIRTDTPLRSVCLASVKPAAGTPAMAAGYPDGSTTPATPTGKVIDHDNPHVVRFAIITRHGMDGGALFDEAGQLLGIVVGHGQARPLATAFTPVNDGTGFAIAAPTCRQFLQRTIGAVPDCGRLEPPVPVKKKDPTVNEPTPAAPSPIDSEDLAGLWVEIEEIKAKLSVNTESTREVITIQGPPGPPGQDGQPGKDADMTELAALRAVVQQLRAEINATELKADSRWTQTADMISSVGLDADKALDGLEKLQARVGANANAAAGADSALRERLAEQQARILALEKFTREHRVTVQILDPNGDVIREESFGLYEPIKLQLKPRDARYRGQASAVEVKRIGFSF